MAGRSGGGREVVRKEAMLEARFMQNNEIKKYI